MMFKVKLSIFCSKERRGYFFKKSSCSKEIVNKSITSELIKLLIYENIKLFSYELFNFLTYEFRNL